jgi:hypothetical protein
VRILFLTVLLSCSGLPLNNKNLKTSSSHFFDYTDQSGSYTYKRELKSAKGKLITRVNLLSKDNLELEKTVAVSSLGMIKNDSNSSVSILPNVSQFKIWFDKKEFFSQVKILRKSRSLEVTVKNQQESTVKEYSLPKGRYFCFFSQIPECLAKQNLLFLSSKKKIPLYIIWDNFPYHVELFRGISDKPYTSATIALEGHDKNELKYSLDIGNQVLFYHYNRKLEFVKMFWISQGISVVRR